MKGTKGMHWKWSTNKRVEVSKVIIRNTRKEVERHLRTIFTGGYECRDSSILYDYQEGDII